jgi:5-methylcytosine-specific restriction enzyme A
VFRLVPLSAETADAELDEASQAKSLEERRQAAYAAAATPTQPPKDARRNFFERSEAVRLYVLKRALGRCEA